MEQERIPRPGEFYKHFKGNLYQIITVATHSETGEAMVVYQALYGDFKTYCRTLEMFISKVDRGKYPFVTQEYRFELYIMEPGNIHEDKADHESVTGKQNNVQMNKEADNLEKTDEEEVNLNSPVIHKNSEDQESGFNPDLIFFLDARTYQDKLNVLVSLKNKLDDRLLEDIAISMDITLEEGTLEERYQILRDSLLTLNRFECNRLR